MKVRPSKPGEVIVELNDSDESLLSKAATTPFRIRKILVPTDFSECSRKALRYAIPMAEQNGATLVLLYVAPTPAYASGEYGGIDYSAIQTDMVAAGEKELAKWAVVELPSRVPVQKVVRSGSPTAEILDLAKTMPADLVIISTHGYSGLKHVLMGSVAEHVVRHASCPVLVVREHEHEFLAEADAEPQKTSSTLLV